MPRITENLRDLNLKTISVSLQPDNKQIIWLRFNRPHAYNAISMEMLHEIHQVLDLLEHPVSMHDEDFSPAQHPRVLIIASTSKAFSGGVDIKAADRGIGGKKWDYKDMRSQQLLARMVTKFRQIPQPVIAAISGPASGAGLAMALASDVRIASVSASFSAAFIRLGLTGTDMGTSFFMPKIAGLGVASEALLTGRMISAERSYQLGLVNELVADTELENATLKMATDMLQCSVVGLQLTKEQLNAVSDNMSLRAALTAENSHQMLLVRDKVSERIAQKWLDSMLLKKGDGGGRSIHNHDKNVHQKEEHRRSKL